MADPSPAATCDALTDPKFQDSSFWAWGVCPACIDSNADIAGLGVIIGIIGQAFLMNVAILIWWFLGTPWKWYLRRFRRDMSEKLQNWAQKRRLNLQRVLLMASDTQAVTGIALTTAGLMQVKVLPLYDLAVTLDLLSISANGHAVLLLYGLRQRRIFQVELAINQNQREPAQWPKVLWWKFILNPRLLISLSYISTYFSFSALVIQRFENATSNHDCLLNYPPQSGNYGKWGVGEAGLMLVIAMVAFLQDFIPLRSISEHRGKWLTWVYDAFLPVFTIVYFLWNLADLITLKIANRPTLILDNENAIEGFGQIVPVILLILPGLALWDLWTGE